MKKLLSIIFFTCSSLYSYNNYQDALIYAINSASAPEASGHASQAIHATNPNNMLFISGQFPIDPITNKLINDPAQATEQCMQNIQAILQAAGMDFGHVVKTTILLTDMKNFEIVNSVYAQFLQEPYPAQTVYQVAALPKDACVQIEVTAIS